MSLINNGCFPSQVESTSHLKLFYTFCNIIKNLKHITSQHRQTMLFSRQMILLGPDMFLVIVVRQDILTEIYKVFLISANLFNAEWKKNCSEIFSVLSLLSRHFAQKVHIIYAFLQQSKSIIFSRPFVNRDISVGSPRRPSSGKSWLREDLDSILLNKFCPKKLKLS